MPLLLGLPIALVLSFLGCRAWLLHRRSPRKHQEPFDGVVYAVGKAAVADRGPAAPEVTVVAMHGFLEDMRYFTEHYRQPELQLVLVNSCDYHVPFGDGAPLPARWAKTPTATEGSVRYDAEVLNQALEHLPRSKRIRVHGHSRGGAVILEAASMRPDLFENVQVVLEAPVLPRGKPYQPLSAAALFLFPFGVPLWRRQPISPRNAGAYGALENARKRELIEALPFHPKHVAVMMANLEGIGAWMAERDASLYARVKGVVLVPDRDRVLDAESMRASAALGAPNLEITELAGCSHFVLFDRPDALPPLPA